MESEKRDGKKIAIMQPYFFPYIGYWQLINAVDEFIIFDDVNYIKRGWINRNHILYQGGEKRINIHIKDASQNRLINETYLAETASDSERTLETITQAYKHAPYFEPVYSIIKSIMTYQTNELVPFLSNELRVICEYLDIHTLIMKSSDMKKNNNLRGEEKIIEMCKKRGADCYVNAIGGKTLYSKDQFEKGGIDLRFISTNQIRYKQFENEFVPFLSIIDVLMFNDKEKVKRFLEEYTLVDG